MTPKFCKYRSVPLEISGAVEAELSQLEESGVLKKVSCSDWVVAVPKKDGKMRICGDYKVTVNRCLEVDQYPLPKPDDLFATLAGGKFFSTLDLSHAYNQLPLHKDSCKYVTITTHRGLYQYTRLPFGIASSPAIFQKTMDCILQGLDGVICCLDDLLVMGTTAEEHLRNLENVLQRLEKHGIRLRKEKCQFVVPSVEYLGHKVDAEGLHATESKMQAIKKAPAPQNVQELRSFLGLLNYYGRFIENLASLLHPLHRLLRQDTKWKWTKDCERAFQAAKAKLSSSCVLTHFNPSLPLRLAGDASAYGLGAVISHLLPDGTERPIAFASRTLNSSERIYAQVEKEALSLIFGVKRFHTYLYGRPFTLLTDHKPLTAILGPKKGIPPVAAARLQRWAILLSAYQYTIEFRPTKAHANADGLSRLPLNVTTSEGYSVEVEAYNLAQIDSLPVRAASLKTATAQDAVLSRVLQFVREGWPHKIEEYYKPFWKQREGLTVEAGCLLRGARVVIPKVLREKVLVELHMEHPGVSQMKAIARCYFWWPGLDVEIERLARECELCQAVKKAPPVSTLHPWVWPEKPWKRIHIDYAGPFQGVMFLVIVDAYSKWPEVFIQSQTTATKTIAALQQVFAAYGLPEQVVTDNGPQFVAEEFETFLRRNGVRHIRSAPYHPASNGQAERFVQSLKQALKASKSDGRTLEQRLYNYLLLYRSSPQATTQVSPASLFLQRELRTRFDLLLPDVQSCVRDKQASQKAHHDQSVSGLWVRKCLPEVHYKDQSGCLLLLLRS